MYLIVGVKSNEKYVKELSKFLKDKNVNNITYISSTIIDITLFVEKNWTKYERIIMLDDHGIFPFMYLTKIHKLVVARITDVYSAYMTPLHNNTKVIIIPTSIISMKLINKLAKFFIDAQFEAGRHMVRIDMLYKETE